MFHIGQHLYFDESAGSFVYKDNVPIRNLKLTTRAVRNIVDKPMESPWKVIDGFQDSFSEIYDGLAAFAEIITSVIAGDTEVLSNCINQYLVGKDGDLSLAIPGYDVWKLHLDNELQVVYLRNGERDIPLAIKDGDAWKIADLSDDTVAQLKSIATDVAEALASYGGVTDFIDAIQSGATDSDSLFQSLSLNDSFDEAKMIISDLFNTFRSGGVIGLVSKIGSLLLGFENASYTNSTYLFEYPEYRSLSVIGFVVSAFETVGNALRAIWDFLTGKGRAVISNVFAKLSNVIPALKESNFTVSRNWSSTTVMYPLQSSGVVDIHRASVATLIPEKVMNRLNSTHRGQYVVQSLKTCDCVYALTKDDTIMRAVLPTLNYDLTVNNADYPVEILGIVNDSNGVTLDVNYHCNATAANAYKPLTKGSSFHISQVLRSVLLGNDDSVIFEPDLDTYKRIFSGLWILLTRGWEITDHSDPDDEVPVDVVNGLRITCAAADLDAYTTSLALVAQALKWLKDGTSNLDTYFNRLMQIIPYWKNLVNTVDDHNQYLYMRWSMTSPNFPDFSIVCYDALTIIPDRFHLDDSDYESIFSVSNYYGGINLPRSNFKDFITNIISVMMGIATAIVVTKAALGASRLIFRSRIKGLMRTRYLDIAATESALSKAIADNDADGIKNLSGLITNKIFKYNILARIFKYGHLGYVDGWISGGSSGGWLNTLANVSSTAANISSVSGDIGSVIQRSSELTDGTIKAVGRLIKADF